MPWEQPKTVGLLLVGLGCVLKTPPDHWLLNQGFMHGVWLLVAQVLIVTGIAHFAYSAECKLRDDASLRTWHIRAIIAPWATGFGAMVGLFAAGGGRGLGVYRFPTGLTMAYWLTYDALMLYFLMLCAYALVYLLRDPPSRVSAGIYMLAVLLYVACITCRVLVVSVDDHLPDPLLFNTSALMSSLAIGLFAIGAAYQWRRRLRAVGECGNTQKQSVIKNTLVKRDTPPHCA